MDAADKLLAAIEAVQVEVRETRDEARARDEKIGQRLDEHDARFQRVEADTAVLRGNVVELQEWRNESAKQMSSQAQAMTSMAQAITNATNVALDAKASASTSVDEARKIVESRHYYASAAPTTGFWRQGDVVWHNAPVAAGTPGWVCVTSGQSDAAAWAAGTAYYVGDTVRPTVSNGFVYQAIWSGYPGRPYTNATTEPTWPTVIGNSVADNGITWQCVGVSTGAVFKAMAAVAA